MGTSAGQLRRQQFLVQSHEVTNLYVAGPGHLPDLWRFQIPTYTIFGPVAGAPRRIWASKLEHGWRDDPICRQSGALEIADTIHL